MMKTLLSFAAVLLLAATLPAAGQTAQAPGSAINDQIGANNVAVPPALPSSSAAGGSQTVTGTPVTAGRVQVLCLATSASVTQPFFTGTDLSCAP
jgi:hypothetical protein